MRQIRLLSILWIAAWQLASAQQEPLYTQFMHNKLAWNPAYAGSFESPTLIAVHRNQFVGLEGAPQTTALSFNMPYNSVSKSSLAFGVNLVRHSIGITDITSLDLFPFTYILHLRNGNLSGGFQVSIRQFSQDWGDPRLVTSATGDVAVPIESNNKIVVNTGFGFFYKSTRHNWYAGVASPRIVPNNIDFSSVGNDISREVLHLNAMGGYTFKVNDDVKIAPQILLKYAVRSPFQADINGTILLKDKYLGGLTYRTGNGKSVAGESIDLQLGLQATEKLFFCLSYDLSLTALRKYHNGSVELTARYWFNPPPPEDTPIAVPY